MKALLKLIKALLHRKKTENKQFIHKYRANILGSQIRKDNR